MQSFHASFKRCRYDLNRWRTVSSLQPQHTALLDANDGAGWELAAMLLRPRKVQVGNLSLCSWFICHAEHTDLSQSSNLLTAESYRC